VPELQISDRFITAAEYSYCNHGHENNHTGIRQPTHRIHIG